jgi:hypothetical protein
MLDTPTDLTLCQVGTLLIQFNIGPTKGQEGDRAGLVFWLTCVRMTVEGFVDLPVVVVAILSEDIPQEH